MHHSAKDNYVHLTTTPVPRLITSLAVPTIISMLVTSFYNMADTYFVGKINTQSTPDFITFLRHHIAHNDNQRVT